MRAFSSLRTPQTPPLGPRYGPSEIGACSPIDSLLRVLYSYWTVWQHLIDYFEYSFLGFLKIHLCGIDDTQFFCLFSLNLSGGKYQLLCLRGPNQPLKSLCSASSRQQAPICFCQPNKARFGSNSDISIRCQFQASSQSNPVQETKSGGGEVVHIIEDSPSVGHYEFDLIRCFVQPLFEISPYQECPGSELLIMQAMIVLSFSCLSAQ